MFHQVCFSYLSIHQMATYDVIQYVFLCMHVLTKLQDFQHIFLGKVYNAVYLRVYSVPHCMNFVWICRVLFFVLWLVKWLMVIFLLFNYFYLLLLLLSSVNQRVGATTAGCLCSFVSVHLDLEKCNMLWQPIQFTALIKCDFVGLCFVCWSNIACLP